VSRRPTHEQPCPLLAVTAQRATEALGAVKHPQVAYSCVFPQTRGWPYHISVSHASPILGVDSQSPRGGTGAIRRPDLGPGTGPV